jgi:hypothetical protein
VQVLKRNQSSDSPISIKGDVNIGGDGAIGSNAKIVKTINENKRLSLFDILIGLVTVIAGLIEIYKYYTGK